MFRRLKHLCRTRCVLLALLVIAGAAACSDRAQGRAAAPADAPPATGVGAVEVTDVDGKRVRPLDLPPGAKGAVLIFAGVECPISNAFAPEVIRICEAYEQKGFAFYIVHADADVTPEAARAHAHDYGYRCHVLLDGEQRLARQVGATVTPEAAVVDAGGEVVYRGRINDLYIRLAKRRYAPTTNDLRDALDAVASSKLVERPRTAAIGCTIPLAR